MNLELDFKGLELKDINGGDDDGDSVGSMGAAGIDTKRSVSSDLLSESYDFYNAEGVDPLDLELGFDENAIPERRDEVFEQIKDSVSQKQDGSRADISSRSGSVTDSPQVKTADDYQSVPYGIQPRATYEHGKRSTDIMGVTYNGRMRQFIIVDSKGVTAWKRDAVDHRVSRVLYYPKYEYGLITHMVYAKKYNCYFALGKDFSLKVYNRDFFETCSVSADLRSVLFMLFNPVRDELITGGVGGTKIWRFHQQAGKSFTELKPLANYGLTLKYELPNVGGSWVKRVELDHHLEHLYCCSDTDLYVYDLGGKLLFKFERAHMMSITGCRYSLNAGVLVTASIDCEVKVWSLTGGLVHTFRGHSRAVTNLILHPATSSIVITCSLDGTVRMWSLDTMDTLYSLVVSADGVHWMGLTDDNVLFLSTPRAITLWNLNYSHQFWALARSNVTHMSLEGCKGKTTRVMAISDDSSVRLMARSNKKNLCTVLPPPSISPLQRVLSVCYSREFNVIFMLINPHELWVYTTRTDPSCRIAAWDVIAIQAGFSHLQSTSGVGDDFPQSSAISMNKPAPSHRATAIGAGNEALANCCCVSILNSTAILWTDEGCCSPIRDSYLLLGLEDGRILFMDPVIKGHKYLEFKTGKDPVLDMSHDMTHNSLSTVHKLKDRMFIQVWSLPDLELQHEVYVASDLRAYARVGYTMACGHESGCVIFNTLEFATDPGLNKGKMLPPYDEVIDSSHKPEHFEPVIGVDVCPALKIFCSCSKDGAIKIWNEDGILLTEILLEESLTSVCFLNNMGDIIVGFQKHIFIIDHCRVCPQLTVPESDVDAFDKESFICEDPAVLYEGVTPNPDPVTLESYLVPFDIEFSKDFLEGRVKLEPEIVEEEESDKESDVSMAPTEIYRSPCSTPRRRLSQIDLMLGSETSNFDLLKQMKKTLAHLAEKAEKRRHRRRLKRGLTEEAIKQTEAEEAIPDVADLDETDGLAFEFPKFGESPGSTPTSTAPPTPDIQSEEEEDLPEEESKVEPDIEVKIDIMPREQDDIAKFLEAEKLRETSKEKETMKTATPISTPRKKFGLSGYTVDAESLMKKKAPRPARQDPLPTRPQEVKTSEVSLQISEAKSPRREKLMKKRMSISQRKMKSKKANAADEQERAGSPPSSQMETLKLTQQELDVPEKKKFEMPVVDMRRQSTDLEEEDKETLFNDKLAQKEKHFQTRDKTHAEVKSKTLEMPELPPLPSVPVVSSDKKLGDIEQPGQNLSDKKFQTHETAKRLAMDFGSIKAVPPVPDKSAAAREEEKPATDGISEQVGSKMPDVRKESGSSVLGASDHGGQAAFRIGLLAKETADIDVHGLQESPSGLPAEPNPKPASKQQQNSHHLHKQQQQQQQQQLQQQQQQQQVSKGGATKDCSLISSGGSKVENRTNKSTKTNNKSSQKGKKNITQKDTRKTPAKDKQDVDPESLLKDLIEKQKYKKPKSDPMTDLPLNQEMQKNQERISVSGGSSLDSRERSILPIQAHTSGMQGGYVLRDLYDHHLPSIPESDNVLDETDVRLSSPDNSVRKMTTPTVSGIENEIESNHSMSPAPSFARSTMSPSAMIQEVPRHSSPFPPVDGMPDPKWPSEGEESENPQPPSQNSGTESFPSEIEINKKPPAQTEMSLNLSSISALSSQSIPDNQKERSTTLTPINSQRNQEPAPLLEKGMKDEKNIHDNISQLEKGSVDKQREVLPQAENADDVLKEELPIHHGKLSNVSDLNKNIDLSVSEQSQDMEVEESQKSFSSHNSPVSQVDISIKTVEISLAQSKDQGKKTSPNSGEVKSETEKGLKDLREKEEENELSGENWDTDSNAFSPNDDSFIMTSSLSDTDSSQGKDSDKHHQGQASSSSNTEPVLQVKIRRKTWTHHRSKQPMKQANDLTRKLSHNDALTIQRNAYLETLRVRKKRAKSAVEMNIKQSPRQVLKQQQQQHHHTMLEIMPSIANTHCVLCAAEGAHSHSDDQVEDGKIVKDDRKSFKVESQGFTEETTCFPESDNDIEHGVTAPEKQLSKTPGMDSVTLTDSQLVSPVEKTPTPCDTPDPFNSQSASRAMSASSMSQFLAASSPDFIKQHLVNEQLKRMVETRDDSRPESKSDTRPSSDVVDETAVSYEEEMSFDTDIMRVELTVEERTDKTKPNALSGLEEGGLGKTESSDVPDGPILSSVRNRPKTSIETVSLGKPELDEAVKYFRRRPHTAQVKFQTEDLQEAFENSLTRYQKMARCPLSSDNIHRNGDMAFSENWHQRQIERHMLIRMQKELRAQSARQRRQALEQRKVDRRKQLYNEGPSPTLGVSYISRNAPSSSRPASFRSNTAHGYRPAMAIPIPTPISSRPHTATGLHADPSTTQQALPLNPQQQHVEKFMRLQEMEALQREKSELSQERAYRFRLSQKEEEEKTHDTGTVEPPESVDLWLLDPRNPNAMRPKSSKSIPSKCHRYVLVSKPKVRLNLPLPSPLEEELLATRFPDQGERVFRKYEGLLYKPPRRPLYGIEYTPFQATSLH